MAVPITKKGYEALKAELIRLRKEDRPQNIQDIAEAREERQQFIDTRMSELEFKLADCHVIEVGELQSETIVFGATVGLIDVETQEKKQYTLVGQEEADLKKGTISVQSPIGRALIGHRVGDFVEVHRPAGTVEFEIESISFEEI